MDDGRRRQDPVAARGVMVADDDRHPERARSGHLLDGRYAAVGGDEQPRAPAGQPGDGRAVQAIAVGDAIGKVGVNGRPERPERPQQHCGRADAVDVVVAVDGDR